MIDTFSSLTEIVRAIREREVSASEVLEAHLARIDEVNPSLNAVVQLCADRARAEAAEADAAIARGDELGPLHGAPITLKDSHDTAGVVTTGGTLGRKDFVPEADSTVAARLRAAGAILMGKTNTPELTLSGETDNLIYGQTRNPFNPERTPGGSSGGARGDRLRGRLAARPGQRHRRQYSLAVALQRHLRDQADRRPRAAQRTHRALGHGRIGCLDHDRADVPLRRGTSNSRCRSFRVRTVSIHSSTRFRYETRPM